MHHNTMECNNFSENVGRMTSKEYILDDTSAAHCKKNLQILHNSFNLPAMSGQQK